MTYAPPIDDYTFLYRDAFGRDVVAEATGGELTAADAAEIIAGAGEFATEVLHPLSRVGDEIGARFEDGRVHLPDGFAEAYAAFRDAGWVTATAPADAGGDGLPASIQAGLSELWHSANTAFALCGTLSAGAIHALHEVGSDELRETYLSRLVSGEWSGTMNLTEPQAGSDLGAIRTVATPQGDGSWAVRGQKIFITWGDHELADNIVHLVLARTPDAPEGSRGLSLFVVPKHLVASDGSLGERNAVHTVSIEHKMGIHASPTCVLSFEDAVGYLAGDLHGGLAAMFIMMNQARLGIGHQAVGIAERAFQEAASYASERVQGRVMERAEGTPIAEHPDVARLLRSMHSQIFAMRALGVYTGSLFDQGEATRTLAEFFVPIFKGWTSEENLRITSDAIQVYGGMGYIEETGAAQHYRDARIVPIYEGTTAIQANDLIGRKVLRDGGVTAEELFRAIDETVSALRDGGEIAARVGARLERATDAARRATASVLGFADTPRDAYAASVPYLMLLGTLAGGWMHALAVVAASAESDAARRLADADFYGAHHLPRVHALAETVAAGELPSAPEQ